MREGKRSERFSWCEHRWRGDGKIIESRLSHRRTKEIFHRPTNFLAKWPCIKIAEEKRKIERERERIGNENKNRETTGEEETQCSENRKRELKTRRSINKNNRRYPMKITEIAKLKLDLAKRVWRGYFYLEFSPFILNIFQNCYGRIYILLDIFGLLNIWKLNKRQNQIEAK